MIGAILNKIDNLDVVKYLRLMALVIFLFGLVAVLASIFLNLQSSAPNHIMIIYGAAEQFVRIIFRPLILLGVAEIIKTMKEKQND